MKPTALPINNDSRKRYHTLRLRLRKPPTLKLSFSRQAEFHHEWVKRKVGYRIDFDYHRLYKCQAYH